MIKQQVAKILIFLIISIPFCTSIAFAEVNPVTGKATEETGTTDLEAGQQCIEKHKKSSGIADSLDNGVIGTLESVASIMLMICTVMSAIDIVLSAISSLIGFSGDEAGDCCLLGLLTGTKLCIAMQKVFKAWSSVYKLPVVQGLCCLVSCGWCTGKFGCGGIVKNVPVLGQNSESLSNTVGVGKTTTGGGYGNLAIGDFHLNPYENIYTATYCLCPVAILFNIRKLKTIYQVYNCCIEQACTAGISTEACEKQLDEALCMYWKGSILKTVAKILMSILAKYLASQLGEIIKQAAIPKCVLKLMELTNIPGMISQVTESWNWMSTSFNEPTCTDLHFEDIKNRLSGRPVPYNYRLVDKNGDKMYDGVAKNGQVVKPSVTVDDVKAGVVFDGNKGQIIISKIDSQSATDKEGKYSYYIVAGGNTPLLKSGMSYLTLQTDLTQNGYNGKISSIASEGSYHFNTNCNCWKSTIYPDINIIDISASQAAQDPTLTQVYFAQQDYQYQEPNSEYPYGAYVKQGFPPTVCTPQSFPPPTRAISSTYIAQAGAMVTEYTFDEGGPIRSERIALSGEKTVLGTDGIVYASVLSAKTAGAYNDPAEQKAIAEREAQQQANKALAGDLTWKLLDYTLGSFAYSAIDNMCKQDWTSSEPQK
ncbi:MAG: hypothetical protein V1837_04025 [Candidatus Woesearchaeota archaeon]